MELWILFFSIASFFIISNILVAPVLSLIHATFSHESQFHPCQINSISIVIPAYNEEKSILNKIETVINSLQGIDLDVEVIIGSDGSTDRTIEIATMLLQEMNDPRWQLAEFTNEGKCKTLNKLVALARGEVIISTDADIPLPADSVGLAVQAFQSNPRLGCLSCIPCFEGLDIGNQKSYWRMEDKIRRAESDLGKLIVVTGMFYAYRRELFEEIPDGVMADDLWVPLNVLLKGFDSVQIDGLLIPYEKTDEETEVMRRKRVIVGGMDVVRRLWLPLVKSPALFCLVVFHKVNRWALPLWLLLLLCSIVGLWPWFAILGFLGTGLMFNVLGKKKFSTLAYAGVSPILAFGEVVLKKDFARWEHTRKH